MMRLIFTLVLAFSFNNCFGSFTYDEVGNLTNDGVHTYIYNEASRLKEVQIGNTGIVKAKYFYGHQGQRIKKIEGGQTCYYIGSHHKSCNDKSTTFHFVEDQRITSDYSDGKTEILHNDHLGSPFAISDKNGTVISRLEYEPYGEPTAISNRPLQGSYAFSGKELSNTNSYYFEARTLSPSLGSFNRPDPILPIVINSFSLNPYQYANNNPLIYKDDSGELAFLIPVAVFLAKEIAAEAASRATGGATDFLSVRRLGLKSVKFIKKTVDVKKFKKQIPDSMIVCRGGTCSATSFTEGNGVTTDASGIISGVSTGIGNSTESASRNIRNSKVGVTTAGDVRSAGGTIINDHGNHAVVSGITAEEAENLFKNVIKNPNR